MSGPGFAVIYRWRLVAGREEVFAEAWARTTDAIREQRGGLGSRLHRAEDGTWLAYAQWSSREAWERARELGSVDEELAAAMEACVEERLDPITLDPVRDLLVFG